MELISSCECRAILLEKTIQGAEKQHPDLIEFCYECGDSYSTERRFLIIIHDWGGGVNVCFLLSVDCELEPSLLKTRRSQTALGGSAEFKARRHRLLEDHNA